MFFAILLKSAVNIRKIIIPMEVIYVRKKSFKFIRDGGY